MTRRPCALFIVFLIFSTKGKAGKDETEEAKQLLKLVAGDGAADDCFGRSVAISRDGDRVVVGAPLDDDRGYSSGSVYVFDGSIGGKRLLKLAAVDGAAVDGFGRSVAVGSGARVVVGAPSDDDSGSRSGSAYVFDGVSGKQLLKLVAGDGAAYDYFGTSVAVSSDGPRVVVGAYMHDDRGADSGSAYVFDGTTGEQLLKLVASDGAAYDQFGRSVAVSANGARVVVGSFKDDDRGSESGSAYVFDGATGERLLKLVADDGAAGDFFGTSVAVSSDGARVVVSGGFPQGSVYVFDGATGKQLLKLVAYDGAIGDNFGQGGLAVSSDGARVVVGSYGDDDRGAQSGSAYVFDYGERRLKLVADDGAAGDFFGMSVAVSADGTRVLAGAKYDDDRGTDSGSAYEFDVPEPKLDPTPAPTTWTDWLTIVFVIGIALFCVVICVSVRKATHQRQGDLKDDLSASE